ncbi:capsular biosynthesis protein [Lactiplantibacillus plantarum]|nr:capsular biosynthesis protein [Lactiplantibacillus plantarum]
MAVLSEKYPIDIVVTWVDDGDSRWLKKRNNLATQTGTTIDNVRYRDYGLIKYFFRSVDQYCHWVNKIFFITDHQVPSWLDTSNPKLRIIFHEQFIPEKYLPTFNSNVIELNLFRLKDLSEHFILFNDDMLMLNRTHEDDFFKNGLPRLYGIYDILPAKEAFHHSLLNNSIIINKYFKKNRHNMMTTSKFFSPMYGREVVKNLLLFPWTDISGYFNAHLAVPHLKSTFSVIYEKEPRLFESVFSDHFRIPTNEINQWIMSYWNIEMGEFYPQSLKLGEYCTVDQLDEIAKVLRTNTREKILCINDTELTNENFERVHSRLTKILNEHFPNKCSFEL